MAGQHVISDALPTDILEEYEVKETLGSGHFAKVKLGIHKATGQQVAIKVRRAAAHAHTHTQRAPPESASSALSGA